MPGILKENINKIYLFGLMLLAFIMPLQKTVFTWVLVAFVVFWIGSGELKIKVQSLNHNIKSLLFFISFYFLYILGLIYTSNMASGIFDLQIKVCLFVFPFVFFSISKKIVLKPILLSFIAGCFVSFLICICVAFYKYFLTHKTGGFYYNELSMTFHPSYLSMYVDFAIACLISFEFDRRKNTLFYPRYFSIILIFIFSVFVGLLSSKMGIIVFILIFLFSITILILKYHKIKIGLGIITLCLIITSTFLYFNPYIYDRFDTARKSFLGQYHDPVDGTYNREHIWESGISIIMKNTLIGVGTGDTKDELLNEYLRTNLKDAYDKRLNAHNQFIQTFISIGILGFLILLALFIVPFIFAWKKKNWLFILFTTIVFVNFLVESMLETQAGVVFFAFFNTLLFLDLKKE
jgi:O-antigen ligase